MKVLRTDFFHLRPHRVVGRTTPSFLRSREVIFRSSRLDVDITLSFRLLSFVSIDIVIVISRQEYQIPFIPFIIWVSSYPSVPLFTSQSPSVITKVPHSFVRFIFFLRRSLFSSTSIRFFRLLYITYKLLSSHKSLVF